MVGHDDCRVQLNRSAMVVKAVLQRKSAGSWRELQGLQSAEGYEERAIVPLVVWKAAAIFVPAEDGCGHFRSC